MKTKLTLTPSIAQARAQNDPDDEADVLEPQVATLKRKMDRADRDQAQVHNQLQQLSITVNT